MATNAAKSHAEKKWRDSCVFGEVSSKKVKEGAAGMQERLEKVSLKVVAGDKDSKNRVREARMVEAVEETDELEASVKRRRQRMKEDTLNCAIDILQENMAKNPAALMQVDTSSLHSAIKVLGEVVNAAAFSSSYQSKTMALVQQQSGSG